MSDYLRYDIGNQCDAEIGRCRTKMVLAVDGEWVYHADVAPLLADAALGRAVREALERIDAGEVLRCVECGANPTPSTMYPYPSQNIGAYDVCDHRRGGRMVEQSRVWNAGQLAAIARKAAGKSTNGAFNARVSNDEQ